MATDAVVLGDEELRTIPWCQRIDLGRGVVTPGFDDPLSRLPELRLPESLDGQAVLDLTADDGFHSFEAERRGASRVVAIAGPSDRDRRGFRYAHKVLGSNVEEIDLDLRELAPERLGTFDLVLFLGELNRLSYPVLALKRIARVTRGVLILEAHVDLLAFERPVLAYYPSDECAGDPSIRFGPNRAAVAGMLQTAGFAHVRGFPALPVPYTVRGSASGTYGRMVFHAWK